MDLSVRSPLRSLRRTAVSRLLNCMLIVFGLSADCAVVASGFVSDESASQSTIDLTAVDAGDSPATHVTYSLRISGTLKTPAKDGEAPWKMASEAKFEFDQKRYSSDKSESHGIRAARRFQTAETHLTVAEGHKTDITLPAQSRLIYLYGAELQMTQLSPDVRLTREQADLLQFPCDPLVANGLLPDRVLSDKSEKWNAAPWVVPMLTGIDAAVKQEADCRLKSLSSSEAIIEFQCQGSGAVTGSPTEVQVSGEMTFDRQSRILRKLKATLKEKRSSGTVSPGLDILAEIEWTQSEAKDASGLPESIPSSNPDRRQLLLTLVTPWRILMLHDRSWYVFHETNDMVMLRMLNAGSLVAQCNISSAPLLSPGSFTPEDKFLEEVQKSVNERGGAITGSNVTTDRNGWRIHHVQAKGEASKKELIWDYYLCAAANGEQISLVFSHAAEDSKLFDGQADQFLSSLTNRPSRPKIALPR